MATVTPQQVKELRERTGVSVMQCKKALEEAGGDSERALEALKRKGAEIAAKKSERELGAGVIASYVHSDNRIGVLVELLSETDFVARNDAFKELATDIAMHIAAMNPRYIGEKDVPEEEKGGVSDEHLLLKQPFVREPDATVQELIERHIQKLGENIEVSRFVRYCLLEA